MTESKYGNYIIDTPNVQRLANGVLPDGQRVKGRTLSHTYIEDALIKGAPMHVFISGIHTIPDPNPWLKSHTHPHDEIILFMGTNPHDITHLGAEIEIPLVVVVPEVRTLRPGNGQRVDELLCRPRVEHVSPILGPHRFDTGGFARLRACMLRHAESLRPRPPHGSWSISGFVATPRVSSQGGRGRDRSLLQQSDREAGRSSKEAPCSTGVRRISSGSSSWWPS